MLRKEKAEYCFSSRPADAYVMTTCRILGILALETGKVPVSKPACWLVTSHQSEPERVLVRMLGSGERLMQQIAPPSPRESDYDEDEQKLMRDLERAMVVPSYSPHTRSRQLSTSPLLSPRNRRNQGHTLDDWQGMSLGEVLEVNNGSETNKKSHVCKISPVNFRH